MRIFFAAPRSAWVDLNLRRSLEGMGHELVRFDFPGWPKDDDPVWQRVGKPRTNQQLLDRFRDAHAQAPIDLFFGYLYSSVVYPETVDLIRKSGVPTVNFSCNNVHQFDLVQDIAPRFDLCVVPELSAQADFHAVGARPVRIQLAANPRVYRPYPEPRVFDVTFVGQRYADRAEYLLHLHRNGIDVRAWGAGWQPRKQLDLAHVKAALALVEDERFDGVRRLVRTRLTTWRGRNDAPTAQSNGAVMSVRQATDGRTAAASQRGDEVDATATVGETRGAAKDARPTTQAERYSAVTTTDVEDEAARAHAASHVARSTPPETFGQGIAEAMHAVSRADVRTAAARTMHAGGPAETHSATGEGNGANSPVLASEEIDTSAYGGPRLLQVDLIKMFSRSRVSLGFATAGDSHRSSKRLTHLRLREFEAPMSGALYLTEAQVELAEYFEPGKEVLTYSDRDEMLDVVRFYLMHDELAERIRRAGLERARREHTWQHRFRELFRVLGLQSE